MSLERVLATLRESGFNLTGGLSREAYDEYAPPAWQTSRISASCKAVLVVGNGGRWLWPRFRASPEASLRRNPVDRYTRRAFERAAAVATHPAGIALYNERREGAYLPLVALAQRAGFGTPGRVGVLIHPEFGPWIALRGVLFMGEAIREDPPARFEPCSGCAAPCEPACHGGVVSEMGVDYRACYRTKLLRGECRTRCDARRACVIGREHAYDPDQVVHHSRIRWRPSTLVRAIGILVRPGAPVARG